MEAKTYAAIDIGSNGARLLIKRFDDNAPEFDRIKRVLFIRVPLRLGKDVFTLGKISKEREVMMMHMMKGFKHFMLLNQVDDYRACATAAMRDAENGKKIMKTIMQETGIKLEIIRGEEEARLLCNNVIEQTNSNSGSYAYVDVGGGSTEISLLHDGVLAESHSFNIGTLRMLSGKVTNATKYQMRGMLDTYAEEFPGVQIIGSGGNINKLFKLTHNKNDEKVMKVSELREIYQELAQLNEEERKEKYGLKDDRVDVIIPAAEIFLMVASGLKCDAIYVPNISLADSIVDGMYRSQLKKQG
ncbi:MAG: Ppx/GppA family phosphatase [Prevotella bivia]|uniref:Ppx/GppA phosphatase family protein n=1 Tax=Prevotella bivia TaxID=28125 RepID=A0A137SVH8_9BACT|nr:exopolyphosphatase [Prevotella bivia]KGF18034.1 exopolyphosphatase [Prevotella bivia DNF00188]KGF34004.1 exopolyphosphatase [Prevotella bivia DNF00650]KXO16448.1 Ppx/GppA phosphatase family protein [Prevotella bivia]KXU59944.1 Ppx/GppA phosphatase family protein [Prevotella bivia]MDK7763955.1 Ppx/GppA family phosphatase [Prevotella bivia]